MMARLRLVLCGLCVVVAVMFVALLLLREDAGVSDSPRSPFSGALLPTGIRAPDFRLTDESGATVTMAGLRGQVVLATFVYSTCEESCGPQLQLVRRTTEQQ